MSVLENIKKQASLLNKNVVLPEGEDSRVVLAASLAVKEGIARVTLLGNPDEIAKNNPGVDLSGVTVIDPVTYSKTEEYKGNRQVLVMEEHPFTISELEYENYGFKIQYMISEVDDVKNEYLLNAGFFAGKGRRGWIEKEGS